MQVRSLSPTSFWIEVPLTTGTPGLIWRAMSECGLVRGKINSSSTTHFSLDPGDHQHIVQGLTPLGLFAQNVLVQAHLTSVDEGTSVKLDAANARGDFDFGTSSRLKEEYATNLENFFRHVPDNWVQLEAPTAAPIASPTGQKANTAHEAPGFGVVLPFDHEAPYRQLRSALYMAGLTIAYTLGVLGPFLLVLWCWILWAWKRGQKVAWWEPLLLTGVSLFEAGRFFNWF